MALHHRMNRRSFIASTLGAAGVMGAAGTALLTAGCGVRTVAPLDGGFAGIDMERGHALRAQWRQPSASLPTPHSTRRTRVVIAGGGMAGLAAARALRSSGIDDFVLLELQDHAGGNSQGGNVAGIACPLGAHYLPLPGDAAHVVQDWLQELGLRQRVAGRWQYDERHLCHSPQERLYLHGHWQSGLLPTEDVPASTLVQYRQFARAVHTAQTQAAYAMPAWSTWGTSGMPAAHQALDAVPFAQWLAQQGLSDAYLLWYLDYCCRDDYGAGIHTVSAWAGLHYFASRHGFEAPELHSGSAAHESIDSVLTWPQGNGWLAEQLAAPLASGPLHSGMGVLRITEARHGVEVDALDHASGQTVRWQAERCIVALPIMVARHVVAQPPDWLVQATQHTHSAPWLVTNVHISAPLNDQPHGAPMSWDNVLYTGSSTTGAVTGVGTGAANTNALGGLGYVNAGHQRLAPGRIITDPTVLTYYQALGDTPNSRRLLEQQPWQHWAQAAIDTLSVPHPDLPQRVTRAEVTRYGHAMAIPTPGTVRFLSTLTLGTPTHGQVRSYGERTTIAASPATERLVFAHSDWAGYSVLEEAFTRGHAAGLWAAR